MPYYRTCHICGSNLDPGETCDCMEKGKENAIRLGKFIKKIKADTENEQIEFDFNSMPCFEVISE